MILSATYRGLNSVVVPQVEPSPVPGDMWLATTVAIVLIGVFGVLFVLLSIRDLWKWPTSWVPVGSFWKWWLGALASMFVALLAGFGLSKWQEGVESDAQDGWSASFVEATTVYEERMMDTYGVTPIGSPGFYSPELGEGYTREVRFPDDTIGECDVVRTVSGSDWIDTWTCDPPTPLNPSQGGSS